MIAAWNGTKWLALGTPAFDSIVLGGAVSGRVFYATGAFTQAALMLPHTAGIAQFGLPGLATAPRSPSGTSGTKKVTLKWTAPATTNGSGPVRDYIVQWRKGSTGAWHTFTDGVKSTTGAVVTGLASGTTYQFHVAAKTDWGIGAYSAIVTKKAN
ncbi:MAG: fibronectin type III domain-containing protein [Chloroflexota bacterium]